MKRTNECNIHRSQIRSLRTSSNEGTYGASSKVRCSVVGQVIVSVIRFRITCLFWLSFHFGPPPWYSYHPALLNLRPFDHQVQTHRANNVLSINSLPFKRYLTSGTFVPSYDIILWKSILS